MVAKRGVFLRIGPETEQAIGEMAKGIGSKSKVVEVAVRRLGDELKRKPVKSVEDQLNEC